MTDIPKPGPVTPIRAVPVRNSGSGLNDDGAEARRRIVLDVIREGKVVINDTFDLLTITAWIETREPFYDEEAT